MVEERPSSRSPASVDVSGVVMLQIVGLVNGRVPGEVASDW